MFKIQGDRNAFYQWDIDQKIIVDVDCTEVHFTNDNENAPVVNVVEEDGVKYANVPNILLQEAKPITAYAYDGCTKYQNTFRVIGRAKPEDYVYTETEVKTWDSLDERVKALEKNGSSGGVVNSDGLTMTDRATGRNYTLYINNGKLTMEGM
jgi:hypothetical protein